MRPEFYGLLEYKHPTLELELRNDVHPELQGIVLDLADWCHKTSLHKPVLTCLIRTKEENEAAGGVKNSLHLIGCAADVRSWVWNEESEMPSVNTWLRGEMAKRGGRSNWEMLFHDAGNGKHLHIGRRDPFWASRKPEVT